MFRKLKMKRQRAEQGYCDEDIYNVYDWFLNIVPRVLIDFNKNRIGHPCDLTDKEWDNIIERIIFCLSEANEDICTQTNEFSPVTNLTKWEEREDELGKYRNSMLKEGLELFTKYFWNLWD